MASARSNPVGRTDAHQDRYEEYPGTLRDRGARAAPGRAVDVTAVGDMIDTASSSWNERRVAGALLVFGFGLLMVRAALFILDDASLSRWSGDALEAGLITTILGMAILELALQKAGQPSWDALARSPT